MTANELYEYLKNKAANVREQTCDGVIVGDPDTRVTRVMTCFKLTSALVGQARERNIPVIICHEPIFSDGEDPAAVTGYDIRKRDLILNAGIAVIRFHDHAHESVPDYIHRGFIERMGLKIEKQFPRESLGVCRYALETPMTAGAVTALTKEKLGAEFPRLVGDADMPVRVVCLALGSIGLAQIRLLERPDCDMVITGEVGEVNVCSYVHDINYFGNRKSLLLLGHCTSEYSGMMMLADDLNRWGIPAEYMHCGEVYRGV